MINPHYTLRRVLCPNKPGKNLILTLLAILLLSFAGEGAVRNALPDSITPGEAFIKIPQQELDLLSVAMRRDMVDYLTLKDSLNYQKSNVFSGKSWIEAASRNYMKVHLSDVSDIQIRILPLRRGGEIVMTLYTISDGGDTADTTLKFYNSAMQEIPARKFFRLPEPKDFYNIPKDSDVTRRELEEAIPFYTVAYTIEPDGYILTGRLTVNDYLTREQAERYMPLLRNLLRWEWDGNRWIPLFK